MPDFRCFAPHAAAGESRITLSPEESRHLVRVNRARTGAEVSVFDGRGNEWVCELVSTGKEAVLETRTHAVLPPPPCPVILAQALPKGKTMDQIVRKATELGVAEIVPLLTARTEVRLDAARGETKTDKWEQTAVEAAKQSGNSRLPVIAPVQSLSDWLAAARLPDLRLVGSLHPGARHLRSVVDELRSANAFPPSSAGWVIGPEGDLTPEEMEALLSAGCKPVTFGRAVLRCDTAAITALGILHYELEAPIWAK